MASTQNECDVCGREFPTEIGMKRHKGRGHKPYMFKEKLVKLHFDEGMTLREIADELDTDSGTVSRWMGWHDIETRSQVEAKDGYEFSDGELKEMYHEKGMTVTEIANEVGIDDSNVTRKLQNRGIETREYSGPNHPHWKGGDVTYDCDWCGEESNTDRGTYNSSEHHFCSKDCMHGWLSEYNSGKGERVSLECEWCGDRFETYPFKADSAKYCSRDCVYEHLASMTGEDHPNYKGEHGSYMGPNWEEKRNERLQIDDYSCMICGMDESEHESKHGDGIHVHHVVPRSQFWNDGEIDWEKANDIDNLVTLCASCHMKWEGIPLIPQIEQTSQEVADD